MNQITDPPNVYNAGLDFDYTVWSADTRITMVNVPWNNDYRDIVKFANQAELDAYLDARENAYTRIKMQYARVGIPIRVEIPFAQAYKYNYIRVSNPAQPINGDVARSYYYFITDIRHVSPGTTEIQVQLDVWQSFGRDIQIGSSFVERGHIGIANEKAFDNFGRDYLTVPEGLDTGAEYRIIAKRREDIANLEYTPPAAYKWYDILVVSATDLLADPGSVADPELKSAPGGGMQSVQSGATFYVFNGSDSSFTQWLTAMKDYPWVTQGIISATMVPRITRYRPDFDYAPTGLPKRLVSTIEYYPIDYAMFNNWRDSVINSIPTRYRHLKKFLTFPYMCIEMTTWYGAPVVLKPESWANDDALIHERISYTPPNQRMSFHPRRYNANNENTPIEDLYPDFVGVIPGYEGNDGDDQGDYLDIATYITSFPQSPIVNDMAVSYLASNAHGLAFQNDSAQWSEQKALRGASNAYDQASRSMQLNSDMGRIARDATMRNTVLQNNTMEQQRLVQAAQQIGGGVAGGSLGGPAGAAIGGASGVAAAVAGQFQLGIQQNANMAAAGISTDANRWGVDSQNSASGFMRDTNRQLAEWAARGDYENTIAGIQARVQDSRMIQPSVGGQFGGDAMNFNNNTVELNLRWKLIDTAHIRAIGDYWLRYGYAVSQFANIPDSLMVMTKFTYWKLSETYFRSAVMPEGFKQILRGIFEKGVTVWKNADDIGVIDWADNAPLPGVVL